MAVEGDMRRIVGLLCREYGWESASCGNVVSMASRRLADLTEKLS